VENRTPLNWPIKVIKNFVLENNRRKHVEIQKQSKDQKNVHPQCAVDNSTTDAKFEF